MITEVSKMDRKFLACKTIKNKIEGFIAGGIYQNLDEFIKNNPDFSTFQEKTKLNNSIRRVWGFDVSEEDYKQLLDELKIELEEKLHIEKERLTTVQVNGKEITTYQGETEQIVVDNTYANKSVEEQLPELQGKYAMFREADSTKDMMQFMQDEIKPEPAFTEAATINNSNLSSEEQQTAEVVEAYREQTDGIVHVDFENKIIMDQGEILSIEERDGVQGVYRPEEIQPAEEQVVAKQKTKKRKKMKKQAGSATSIALALLSGVAMGLAFLNLYLRII